MVVPSSRRIAAPPLSVQATAPICVGCRCCSCNPGTIDRYCRAHGGSTTRYCEQHRHPGITGRGSSDPAPVSVQQKRAGIEENPGG